MSKNTKIPVLNRQDWDLKFINKSLGDSLLNEEEEALKLIIYTPTVAIVT
ncbi:MAG: hypothetical protein J6584_07095 [Lactobacillus sp.]|nr:hypothetical protein [Bombilactobacillus bombi]MCO6543712.1 hypothetical protein [Lactobacillus sp.]